MSAQQNDCPYLWQKKQYDLVISALNNGQLPHALLLVGQPGLGKGQLVMHLTKRVLCEHSHHNSAPCHQCSSCVLIQNASHPDVMVVETEEKSSVLKVEQIRQVAQFVSQSSKGKYKIVCLKDAERLNESSANALLKTLEEPSHNTLIILTTAHLNQLKPTIRSRCQKLHFIPPTKNLISVWLQERQINIQQDELDLLFTLTGQSPLNIIDWVKQERLKESLAIVKDFCSFLHSKSDLVNLSQKWSKLDIGFLALTLSAFLLDLAKSRYHSSVLEKWQIDSLWLGSSHAQVLRAIQELNQLAALIKASPGINQQLQLEKFLLSWVEKAKCA